MEEFVIKLDQITNIELTFSENLRIYLPIHGKIYSLVGSEDKVINKEEMLIVNPFELALLYPAKEEIENLLFKIEISKEFLEKNKLDAFFYNNHIYNERIDSFLLSTIDEMYVESKNNTSEVEKLLLAFLIKLTRDKYIVDRKCKLNSKEEEIIKQYMDMMIKEEEFVDKGLDELALMFKTSTSYLSNIFKDIVGFSISKFKQLVKIDKASELLLSSDLTIDDISFKIGYQSPKSLYDIFRINLGMLPLEYRQIFKESFENEISDLTKHHVYSQFKGYSKKLSYCDMYSKYPRYNSYKIRQADKKCDYIYQELKVYDLRSMGNDFYNNISEINSKLGIDYLRININLDKNNPNLIYIANLERYISKLELIQLIELLNKEKIKVSLGVEILNKDIEDYSRDDFAHIQDIQDFIINNITYKYTKDYEWLLTLDGTYNKVFLKTYLNKRISLLDFSMGEKVKISLSISRRKKEKLLVLMDLLEGLDFKSRIDKVYINFLYEDILEINKFDSRGYVNLTYKEMLEKMSKSLVDIDSSFNIEVNEFTIEYNIDENFIESSNVLEYKDLMIATVYTGSIWYFDKNFIYFSLRNKSIDKRINSRIMVEKGFKTSLAFALSYIRAMEGEVIQKEPGMIVIKNEDDLHLVFYNNAAIDTMFALKKNFKNLESYTRKIDIRIEELKGKYKFIEKKINHSYGNIEGILKNFDTNNIFLDSERNYINSINYPQKKIKFIEKYGDFNFNIEMDPYSLVFIDLYKI